MTVNRPASGALVMKHFSPFNTKLSPSRTAVVRSAVASDPACGSVSATHPGNSPDAIRGSSIAARISSSVLMPAPP
ncbi:hypothetical protein G6F55_014357 [Rhizopus delemar]|nr:hypothetical protein G6F55_014357 [Rhizopus delemar]